MHKLKENNETGKKALLVVSFGSSYIQKREASIDAIEDALALAFPEYDPFTAFTSQMIINIYKRRDNIIYKNVSEQIENIYLKGYEEVLVVPTHVINGYEYDDMMKAIEPYILKFSSILTSRPLLSSVTDYKHITHGLMNEMTDVDKKTAIVLLGHGTKHHANSAYAALDYTFKHEGYENVYVGTVEGAPEFDDVVLDVVKGDYEKILLMPFMIVAGTHAHEDMAGDSEDSWRVLFESQGYEVKCMMKGLGELAFIQQFFVEHANQALETENQ